MMLLSQPWSTYEANLERERRHRAARRAVLYVIYCVTCLLAGLTLGVIIAGH